MFDFGFGELVLIGVVALIVLGPERLPKIARAAGVWAGKLQSFVNNVKTELSQQMDASGLGDVKKDVERAARDLQEGFKDAGDAVASAVHDARGGLDVRPAWERVPEQRTPADFGLDGDGRPLADTQVSDAADYGSDAGLPYAPPAVSLKRRAMMQRRDMRPKYKRHPHLGVRKQGGRRA